MKFLRLIMTYVISFLIMMLVFVTIFVFGLTRNFISEDRFLLVLGQVGAYQSIHDRIQNELNDIMLVNNIPLETLNEMITVDEIWDQVDSDVTQVFELMHGERRVVNPMNMSVYESRFDERMKNFFHEYGMYLSEEQKADVLVLKDDVMKTIQGSVQFINFAELTKSDIAQKVASLVGMIDFNLIVTGLVSVIVLLVGIICLMWRRRVYRGLLGSGYGLVAGGLIAFIVFFSGYVSGFYKHIIINIDYIERAFSAIIGDFLKNAFISGLFVAFLGFVMMVPYWSRMYKRYMREEA